GGTTCGIRLELQTVYRAAKVVEKDVVKHIHLRVKHDPQRHVLARVPNDIVVKIERTGWYAARRSLDDIGMGECVLNVTVPHILKQIVVNRIEAVRHDSVGELTQNVVMEIVAIPIDAKTALAGSTVHRSRALT